MEAQVLQTFCTSFWSKFLLSHSPYLSRRSVLPWKRLNSNSLTPHPSLAMDASNILLRRELSWVCLKRNERGSYLLVQNKLVNDLIKIVLNSEEKLSICNFFKVLNLIAHWWTRAIVLITPFYCATTSKNEMSQNSGSIEGLSPLQSWRDEKIAIGSQGFFTKRKKYTRIDFVVHSAYFIRFFGGEGAWGLRCLS